MVDGKGIRELECLMRSSKLCSIDTESDDKDPREGTLLGVAFSVKAGETYFVPLIDNDLKDVGKDDVVFSTCPSRRCFTTLAKTRI